MKSALYNPVALEHVGFLYRLRQSRRCMERLHNDDYIELKNDSSAPTVSVMLITYNHEKYVAQALESILGQECDFKIEINIIDDCSTDATQKIVEVYRDRYPDIINCYFNEHNIGHIATQLNTYRGFQTLRGKYFCILEGDDYWTSPHKLKKQIDFLEANATFVACSHYTLKVFEDGRKPEHFLPFEAFSRDVASMRDLVTMAGVYHLSSTIYRNKFGLNPPLCLADPYSCDVLINMVYGQYGSFYCLNEYMSAYRVHGGGVFSGRSLEVHWVFHLHGYQRFFVYMGYRYWLLFAEAVIIFSKYVVRAHAKGVCDQLKLRTYLFFLIHMAVAYLVVMTGCIFNAFVFLAGGPSRWRRGVGGWTSFRAKILALTPALVRDVLRSIKQSAAEIPSFYFRIVSRLPEPVRSVLRPIKYMFVKLMR